MKMLQSFKLQSFAGLVPVCLCPSCMEEPTGECSTPDVHTVSRGRITSLGVLATLLLVQLRMLLAFFVARAPLQLGI